MTVKEQNAQLEVITEFIKKQKARIERLKKKCENEKSCGKKI